MRVVMKVFLRGRRVEAAARQTKRDGSDGVVGGLGPVTPVSKEDPKGKATRGAPVETGTGRKIFRERCHPIN